MQYGDAAFFQKVEAVFRVVVQVPIGSSGVFLLCGEKKQLRPHLIDARNRSGENGGFGSGRHGFSGERPKGYIRPGGFAIRYMTATVMTTRAAEMMPGFEHVGNLVVSGLIGDEGDGVEGQQHGRRNTEAEGNCRYRGGDAHGRGDGPHRGQNNDYDGGAPE